MKIYKIIATFGIDSELDSRICCTLKQAYKEALIWYKQEDCTSVKIAVEEPDYELGWFRTKKTISIQKPF